MKKKVLSILLSIVMVFSLLPTTMIANAATNESITSGTFDIAGRTIGTLTVGTDEVTIKDSVGGGSIETVTAENMGMGTALTIESGVIGLIDNGFYMCYEITINGGTVDSMELGWGDLIINDGNFTSISYTDYGFNKVAIYGGKFEKGFLASLQNSEFEEGFTIYGGTFGDQPLQKFLAEGLEVPEADENGNYVVGGADPLYQNTTTNAGYLTLAAALLEVQDGETIQILKDAEIESVSTSGKTISIDMNGKTLTVPLAWATLSADPYSVTNTNLTLVGNGTFVGSTDMHAFLEVKDDAALTVKGNIRFEDSEGFGGGAGMWAAIKNSGVLTVDGGTITAYCQGDMNGTGGMCQYPHHGIIRNYGTIVMADGTIQMDSTSYATNVPVSAAIKNETNGILNISGGYVTGLTAKGDAAISGASCQSVTGGFFSTDVSDYVAEKYECVANTDTETNAAYPYMVVEKEAGVAKVSFGGASYECTTWEDVKAKTWEANGDYTITLLKNSYVETTTSVFEKRFKFVNKNEKNTSGNYKYFNGSAGITVTLDLNGQTLQGEGTAGMILLGSTGSVSGPGFNFVIKDGSSEKTGKILHKAYSSETPNQLTGQCRLIEIETYADMSAPLVVTLESGTIEAAYQNVANDSTYDCVAKANGEANFVMNGGKLITRAGGGYAVRHCHKYINDGEIDAYNGAIACRALGDYTEINGGTITSHNGTTLLGYNEVVINGGTLFSEKNMVLTLTSGCETEITGGTFTSTGDGNYGRVVQSQGNLVISGDPVFNGANSQMILAYNAPATIKGGTFNYTGTSYTLYASGATITLEGGIFYGAYHPTQSGSGCVVAEGKAEIQLAENKWTIGEYVTDTVTLQQALDNAKKGDIIVVAAGDYDTVYLRNNSENANRIMEDVTVIAEAGATVNIKQIAHQQKEGKTLDVENLTLDGLTFSNPHLTGVSFDYNDTNGKGRLRVNGLTIQNCTKVGDNTKNHGAYEDANFAAFYHDCNNNTKIFAADENLECGYHNITIKDNVITNVYQPVTFPNSGSKSDLTVTGNTFTNCTDNHIQVSGSEIGGTNTITNNTLVDMTGRFARIAGATADATFVIKDNEVISPKKFDTGGDADIFKITGTKGFAVTDEDNTWIPGDYTSDAKTTWIANGTAVAVIESGTAQGYYGSLQAAITAAQNGDTILLLQNLTVNEAVQLDGKTFTIDLNGKTMSTRKDDLFTLQNENLTVKNGTIDHNIASGSAWEPFFLKGEGAGSLTLDGVNITSPMYSVYVSSSAKNKTITIKDCNLVSTGDGVIFASGADTSNTLNITDTTLSNSNTTTPVLQLATKATLENVTITSESATAVLCYENTDLLVKGTENSFIGKKGSIHTNGSKDLVQITIEGGTFKSTSTSEEDGIAFYHPDGSPLTILGGTFEGATALYVKGGTIDIQGGTFIGTGTYAAAQIVSSGAHATGDAVVIEASDYLAKESYEHEKNPSVTISGGKFSSTNGSPIAYYTFNDNEEAHNGKMVSGGFFNKEISDDLIVKGKMQVETPEGEEKSAGYLYTIGEYAAVVVIGGEPVYFETLEEAIEAAKEAGEKVEVAQTIKTEGGLDIDIEAETENKEAIVSEEIIGEAAIEAAEKIAAAINDGKSGDNKSDIVDLSSSVAAYLTDLDMDKVQAIAEEKGKNEALNTLLGNADETAKGGQNVEITMSVTTDVLAEVKGVKLDAANGITELKLGLTPVYTLTIVSKVEGVESETLEIVTEEMKEELKVEGTTTVRFKAPEGFTLADGETLYVIHTKEDGTKFTYNAAFDGTTGMISFENPNGYSDFTLMKVGGAAVAQNTRTSELYTVLQTALDEAASGDTVILLKDLTAADGSNVDFTIVKPNITLDLNGFDLESEYTLVYGFIKNSAGFTGNVANGELLTARNNLSYMGGKTTTSNDYVLPVWVAADEAYVFCSVSEIGQEWTDAPDGKGGTKPKYRFWPVSDTIGLIFPASADSGISVYVEIKYSTDGSSMDQMEVDFGQSYINDFMKNPDGLAMYLSLMGAEDITVLKATTYLRSDVCNFNLVSEQLTK